MVGFLGEFVDVDTFDAVSIVFNVAGTGEAVDGVGASSISMTVVGFDVTLVDVCTISAVCVTVSDKSSAMTVSPGTYYNL